MPLTTSQLLLNVCNLYITPFLKQEFEKQGHLLTGEWEDSIISQEVGDGEVEIMAQAYGMVVDQGITPDRIPYGGVSTWNTGAGTSGSGFGFGHTEGTGDYHAKFSLYIQALQKYWKLRKPGISDKAALRLAFATAEVQKVEGMSTEASKAFSATGERQHFMETLTTLFEDTVDESIFEGLDLIIEQTAKEPKKMYL